MGSVPFISKSNGRFLYDLILQQRLTNILELGIAHGTATCYMAAALQELGEGSITSVDLIEVKDSFKPSAEQQLASTGLAQFASVVRMQTGYNWFLHDEIAKNTQDNICNEVYDLCIIDGPKNWTMDGAAFFFVDKLLKKNGWLIFDDLAGPMPMQTAAAMQPMASRIVRCPRKSRKRHTSERSSNCW